jgi:exonuclease VII small subunit
MSQQNSPKSEQNCACDKKIKTFERKIAELSEKIKLLEREIATLRKAVRK